jgi:hypothetical protein
LTARHFNRSRHVEKDVPCAQLPHFTCNIADSSSCVVVYRGLNGPIQGDVIRSVCTWIRMRPVRPDISFRFLVIWFHHHLLTRVDSRSLRSQYHLQTAPARLGVRACVTIVSMGCSSSRAHTHRCCVQVRASILRFDFTRTRRCRCVYTLMTSLRMTSCYCPPSSLRCAVAIA